MAEAAMRVALLARPGTACDNLQAALQQAGAEIVLVADPIASDAGAVAAATPGAVLVALEPSVEDVLDRYDPVLLDPAMTVIYDEAELAAKREGWDAARWTRHLSAKLAGHDDVLPPGGEVGGEPEPVIVPDAAPADDALEFVPSDAILPDDGLSLDDFTFELDPVELPTPEPQAGHAPEPEPERAVEMVAEAAVEAPAEARPSFDFSALSLEEMLPEPESAQELEAAPPPVSKSPLAIDAPAVPGAVVVLAGIGGPDAVRQFLAALPGDFSRPVLIRQRLDGGRHDRLVRQMQRATPLPVQLAEAGATLAPGHVYILPDGMGTTGASEGPATFAVAADPVPVLAGLPAADSAILVLSGSDPATVGEVQAAAAAGALLAAQSPEECFDSEASAALIAAGADAGAPADLAARVSARWLS